MSQNSFLLKGWTVILVSGLFALAASRSNVVLGSVALLPATVFWWLDAYYLYQEKLFRELYDDVRTRNDDAIDFSMDTSDIRGAVDPIRKVAFSASILVFHGGVIASIATVAIVSSTL